MATLKINMNLKLFGLSLIFLISFTSCNNNAKSINELTVSELVKTAYELRNDDIFPEICQLLNDSIVESKRFWLQSITVIHKETQMVDWMFLVEFGHLPEVSARLIFDVCINNENEILVMKEFANVNDIKKMANEYKFNPNSIDKLITNEMIYVDYFGETERSNVGFLLSTDVKSRNGLSVEEWTLFFQCMHEIVSVFEDKRNEIANNKWGKNFDLLDYNQKIAIFEMIGFHLSLFFDYNCE
jgi:hypothetical protein